MIQVDLIQPRHSYASKEGLGHIYMPTSLLTVAARLLHSGIDVNLYDENIRPRQISSNIVGINLLGSPYIPIAREIIEEVNKKSGDKISYLLGGQVISGISLEQFTKLFGDSAHNGNDDGTLARILEIDSKSLIKNEQTSLTPAYELISDSDMREYLSREFGLYISQGCKFACDFCAAVRTTKDPITNETRKVIESYRDIDVIKKDIEYLVRRAKRLGINELNLYMSNLDVFQTPNKLTEFASAIKDIKKNSPEFNINLRGLATVSSFVDIQETNRKTIEELVSAGFHTVGFGVDGWGIWKEVHKGHNTEQKCEEAVRSAKEDFGITPEALMVFGHVGADREETLRRAYEKTLEWVEKYHAVPRPHVSKSFIPGNSGWIDPKNAQAVETLMQHPEAFQALDFTALPSRLTHPDANIRRQATEYFLKICAIPGNTTLHVLPITPDLTSEEKEAVKKFNEGRFDR